MPRRVADVPFRDRSRLGAVDVARVCPAPERGGVPGGPLGRRYRAGEAQARRQNVVDPCRGRAGRDDRGEGQGKVGKRGHGGSSRSSRPSDLVPERWCDRGKPNALIDKVSRGAVEPPSSSASGAMSGPGPPTMIASLLMTLMTTWLFVVGALLLGAVLGGAAALWVVRRQYGDRESVRALQQELEGYRREVAEHYAETAKRVDHLTQAYKSVHDHLEDGAYRLVGEQELRQRLKNTRSERVTLDGLAPRRLSGPARNARADDAPASPPRDASAHGSDPAPDGSEASDATGATEPTRTPAATPAQEGTATKDGRTGAERAAERDRSRG